MQTSPRLFNRDTVRVQTHGTHYRFNPAPAVDVKVRVGFEGLTPEQWQELRNEALDSAPGLDSETLARFGREYCEAHADEHDWITSTAAESGVEQAEQEAEALFGNCKVGLTGRSGGWLTVEGLPDVDDWDTEEGCPVGSMPSLKGSMLEGAKFADGTPLNCEAGLFERWAFFVETCEALARDNPRRVADLLLHNVFTREEATRPVDFARAYSDGRWNLLASVPVPCRVRGHANLLKFVRENRASELAESLEHGRLQCLAVYHDPKAGD